MITCCSYCGTALTKDEKQKKRNKDTRIKTCDRCKKEVDLKFPL